MNEFDEIYNKYVKDVYKYILCLCKNEAIAEDIVQDTFLKALNNINNFNGNCQIRVWLCQIAKNTYFTYYNKDKKYQYDFEEGNEISDESIEHKIIDSETSIEIHKKLHFLDEPYKEVFTLRIFGEMSFSQIGELFGRTESWARVTFCRAKLKLKEELK